MFEASKNRARSHAFIPLFAISGVPLTIGFIFALFALSAVGEGRDAPVILHLVFVFAGLLLLVIAISLKISHDNAARYVAAWYKRYPEERPDKKKANATFQISTANELRELKKLLDEGVITQEDFDAKKQQLLK